MSLAGRLSRLVPDLSETLVRFPVPALISVLLFVTALIIGWDGYKAYQRYGSSAQKAPAAADD